ncbi:formate C-acetyltransferase [Cryobacterium sp. TMT1-62]|uniref:Formate acetyltransferase n=1 Tax=Cryobacterium sandaracinum TaxID=1259247 RepID=A0ABY2JBN2_9MICO|nr:MULTISPECIES: formate C-acetyltransferase [Cryobacterium]TFB59419.1 formate C-acetyltransferase [Cryobacterium sp. Hz7]TFB60579.1 formate C-acetyltransferase [Cryobacterium sp. Sr3]TFC38810.1 formate C-acetyltransferase [Cryobacterium sp. TMT2-14]TFC54428.1 formate C-acetyltransferase [Cryobacterium sp. TMT2-17-1]TFC66914.1 formate C-acetyltransferase [Cryobacterium sp. TMT2-4]
MTITEGVRSGTDDAGRTDFASGPWQDSIDLRDFIQRNYTPYLGDSSFLVGATARTTGIWAKLSEMFPEERRKGVYDVDATTPSSITAHAPGYIDQANEVIVGLQTDAPLKRAIMPFGGWRMVATSLETYGYPVSPELEKVFTDYRKTHNTAVFDVYPPGVRRARNSHLITGLPDAYGRGRIIGDYRRVALYGVDALISGKKNDRAELDMEPSTEDIIRAREENSEQIRALKELIQMAASYGSDISKPATTAREAVQWLYFAYLGAVKEQNGAAMSFGRNAAFLDTYIERELVAGTLTEEGAQELIDDLVIKLRIVRFLRTPEYDEIFAGDPTWVTESLAGIGEDGRPLVTKTTFRFLQTLYNIGAAPEPNLTVLWSDALPEGFKRFCAQVSIDTSAIQFESDEIIRAEMGDDAAIACCVSPMRVGKQMQFFGARVNAVKALLYSINGGKDEVSGKQVAPATTPNADEVLSYDTVFPAYLETLEWLAETYVTALNCIHYMHDKYAYERLEMALHDKEIIRTMACGIAGLSVVADSLSAIKYATVRPVRDETGLVVDYTIEGEFPQFGNDDDRVDTIAVDVMERFMKMIRKHPTYRDAIHTQSILTITSNVVYGKATGNTPDGRRKGESFAPGANPMNGRDTHGMLASALSVAKLPYSEAQDGISLTNTVVPSGLGHTKEEQITSLVGLIDAFTSATGYHINVNVLNRDTLEDAMAHPENYPQLTIRVSGYAVNFVRLTREQQMDVISRTFHSH